MSWFVWVSSNVPPAGGDGCPRVGGPTAGKVPGARRHGARPQHVTVFPAFVQQIYG